MVLPALCVLCLCATVIWCAWLWRPLPTPVAQPVAPEPVHGATPELGKWLRENDVQAARFERGNLVEVVLMERRPEEPEKERDKSDDSVMSPMDQALELLASRKGRRGDDAS